MEEKQSVNQQQTQPQEQPKGWKGVVITPDMPASALIQFFNVLNQRLCSLEDVITVPGINKTFTEYYEDEFKRQVEEAEKQAKEEK